MNNGSFTKGDDRRNWHLDKSISLSHMLTTIVVVITGAAYIMSMQAQIEIGREQIKYTQEQIKQMQVVLGEGNVPLRRDIDRIQSDLRSVNDKLDKLILRETRK